MVEGDVIDVHKHYANISSMEVLFETSPINKPQKTKTSISTIKKVITRPTGSSVIKKKS